MDQPAIDAAADAPAAAPALPPSPPPPLRVSRWEKVRRHPLSRLLAAFLVITAGYAVAGPAPRALDPDRLFLHAAIGALAAICGLAVAARMEGITLAESGLPRQGAVAGLAAGFGLGFLVIGGAVAILVLRGEFVVTATLGAQTWPAVLAAVGFAFTGIAEEVAFRGVFFRVLEDLSGTWGALLLTSTLFGLAHAGNPSASVASAVGIAVAAGLLLGGVYVVGRSLWPAIGLHWAWNAFEGPIFGLPVSGLRSPGLLQVTSEGEPLWTGGAFGPEAGLAATLPATVLAILVLIECGRRRAFLPRLKRRVVAEATLVASPATDRADQASG